MKLGKKLITLLAIPLVLVLGYVVMRGAFHVYYTNAYPIKYQEIVEEQSQKTGVPRALIYAVIRSESGFDPTVESSVGARGLMQITEETLDWALYRKKEKANVTFDDLYDPETNIEYGVYILSLLLDEFEKTETALCAYHAGWGNVKNWLTQAEYSSDGVTVHNIPFGDTNRYVKKVMNTMEQYQRLYDMNDETN